MGRTASPKRGWGPRVQPLCPLVESSRFNITSFYGVRRISRREAVRPFLGGWIKGEAARMNLLGCSCFAL